MTAEARTLSLSDLEAHDPRAPARGRNRRFLCPLPACADHQRPEHRSLSANTDTGAWKCHRCGAKGLLAEYHTGPPEPRRRGNWQRERARRAILGETAAPVSEPDPEGIEAARHTHAAAAGNFPGSPAAVYLEGRGVPEAIAAARGCGYAPAWKGIPRVTFPVRNRNGEVVAVTGRAVVECDRGAAHDTRGPKAAGVFNPEALTRDPVILTEAPIDALSLEVCGYPAAALLGTAAPAWLAKALAFKTVLVAFDADEAGDMAAVSLERSGFTLSRAVVRLRPPDPWKDWNAALQGMGAAALTAYLAAAVPQVTAVTGGASTVAPVEPEPVPPAPRVLRLYSRLLAAPVLVCEDGERPDNPDGLSVWNRTELATLIADGAPEATVRQLHEVKRRMGGHFPAPPLPARE